MFIFILIVIGIILISWIKVVPQTKIYIVERLGKYHATWEAGLHLKIPVIDMIVGKVDMKERVLDFPPQNVITKDNVSMKIDSVVYMKVMDPKLYTYGVDNPSIGLGNLAATTLRNIIGTLNFDETLSSRDKINSQMEQVLDEATDAWGIKVTRVEVKSIEPPKDLLDIMTKQMKAEREKRQAILEAEAHRESSIKRAEGDKAAKILAAEAERDAQIALAEGKAKSIKLVYDAEAEGLERLGNAKVNDSVLKLKSIESLKDIANGNSTKIFMPTDIMKTVSELGVKGEALDLNNTMKTNTKSEEPKQQEYDPCLYPDSSDISRDVYSKSLEIEKEMKK